MNHADREPWARMKEKKACDKLARDRRQRLISQVRRGSGSGSHSGSGTGSGSHGCCGGSHCCSSGCSGSHSQSGSGSGVAVAAIYLFAASTSTTIRRASPVLLPDLLSALEGPCIASQST